MSIADRLIRLARIARMGRVVLVDPERKPVWQIVSECASASRIWGELPFAYFTHLLYKSDAPVCSSFLGRREELLVYEQFLANQEGVPLLRDKTKTHEVLAAAGVPTTQLLASVDCTGTQCVATVTGDSRRLPLDKPEDLRGVLSELSTGAEDCTLFMKPTEGYQGRGTFRIGHSDQAPIGLIWEALKEGSYVIEENLVQHSSMRRFYPNSVNTLRVYTHRCEDSVELMSVVARFGTGTNITNNPDRGGVFCAVNLDSWSLEGRGMTKLSQGGQHLDVHPDTAVQFDGYELPFQSETERLLELAAAAFPTQFIGWDVAFTNQGPVILEGNHNPDLQELQMAIGGAASHDRYSSLFAKYLSSAALPSRSLT